MPTFDRLALFKREYRKLTPEQKARFKVSVEKLVAGPAEAVLRQARGARLLDRRRV